MKIKDMDCPFCKAPIAEQATVCRGCGASVQNRIETIAEIIFIVIGLYIMIAVFGFNWFTLIGLGWGGVMIGNRIVALRNGGVWFREGSSRHRG